MKLNIICISFYILALSMTVSSQDIKELKQIESGTEYWEIWEKVSPLLESDTNAAIILIEEAIKNTDNTFTKSSLMKQLGGLYVDTKQYEKCLDVCENLINSGISVFFEFRGIIYPAYTNHLEDNDRFNLLLEINNDLVEKANKDTQAEYFLQKPDDYNTNKMYPLMMIFHGGIGNIQQQQHFWKSAELQEDYILVFVQGRQFLSSGTRRFGNEGIVDIKKIYTKIKNDYLIDTTKVILGGPSAGGMLSIDLAINNHIPVQGLILAFPVKPGAFGADEIYEAGIRGLRVSMICGENDWALESQKEMSVIFDKLNVENRIVIYPENGHEYPDDFEKQISKSIEYTFNN